LPVYPSYTVLFTFLDIGACPQLNFFMVISSDGNNDVTEEKYDQSQSDKALFLITSLTAQRLSVREIGGFS
jgi:hypothetical protein